MIRTRDDFYSPGIPARHGEHYRAFVRFAKKHAGLTVLDVGCGYGAYSRALIEQGVSCVGCDVNFEYLQEAQRGGLPVATVDSVLPFADRTFDSVLLFEVIEHVPRIDKLLQECFRVARRNVLITVPNSEDVALLKANDVTYGHMLSSDHVNFFDANSLRSLLRSYAASVSVERSDPIYPFWFLSRSIPYYGLRLLYRAKLLKPRFYARLYAVAQVS
jgi:ubiquinone/menaquinone biosynthesis C-methylase UbiE